MNIAFSTPLQGNLVLCRDLRDAELQHRPSLYKFVWVRQGSLTLAVDHIPIELRAGELMPLTPLHRIEATRGEGEYLLLAFDSNFYCIFGHDGEVSCNGLLFTGSSEPLRLALTAERQEALDRIVGELLAEYALNDSLSEEMLRMQLKRFIIVCTRAAREYFGADGPEEQLFDIVRRFHVLVDEHFRTRKQVRDYAELLHRSPKTLSNLFAACGRPSPLGVIHDRVNAEARRLALYTDKSAKQIGYLLGYEDTAAFSRFFAKMNGESITSFRSRMQRE